MVASLTKPMGPSKDPQELLLPVVSVQGSGNGAPPGRTCPDFKLDSERHLIIWRWLTQNPTQVLASWIMDTRAMRDVRVVPNQCGRLASSSC